MDLHRPERLLAIIEIISRLFKIKSIFKQLIYIAFHILPQIAAATTSTNNNNDNYYY